MINIYQVPNEEVQKIEWQGDFLEYDKQLLDLGQGYDEFLVVNPDFVMHGLHNKIKSIPPTPGIKCIVWKLNGVWIAKYFNKAWTPELGYWPVNLHLVWERNPDIPDDITYLNDPSKNLIQDLYDLNYEMTWYIDPQYNSEQDKVWVMRCHLSGISLDGVKDMGYLSPDIIIRTIYNRDIPKIDYDFDYKLSWYDFKYECVWYLDNQFNPTPDKIWAIKLKVRGGGVKPVKDMGYVRPKIAYNPALPKLNYTITDKIPYYEFNYEHIWLIDDISIDSYEEIWAAKIIPHESHGTKVVGKIKVDLPENDVVFISYNEPNAEENWRRVLEKSPKAYRVNGVNGIVNAHKCAAEIATTDMFYVVDGDAWLVDDWDFKFQPNLFDRDCVHVWRSQNPVNGLTYGYGGVKLIPKELMLSLEPTCTDMTTSISPKFKIMSKISNTTAFNTSEFNAWRSGFRECAKLSGKVLKRQLTRETEKRLETWCSLGADKLYGEWAIEGAVAGRAFGEQNAGNQEQMALINNFDWLKTQFTELSVLNNSIGEN